MDDLSLTCGIGAVVIGGTGILTGLGPDMGLGLLGASLFGGGCAVAFFFALRILVRFFIWLDEHDD